MKIRLFIAFIVTVMWIPAMAVAGDVIFIGNNQNPESRLSKQEVQYIFLGQKREWSDSSKVVFAVQNSGAAHDSFLERFIGKNSFQFTNYWKKQVFTGKGSPPRSFQNDKEMIKFVSENKGAIGYVSSGAKLENVKTISVN